MKKADKSGASLALIWGEDEVAAGTVAIKTLRGEGTERGAQQTVSLTDLEHTLQALLAGQE